MSLRKSFVLVFSALLSILAGCASAFSYNSARNEAWSILDFQLQQIAQVVGDGSGIAPVKPAGASSDEIVVVRIIPKAGGQAVTNDASVEFPQKPSPGFSIFRSGGVDWRLYARVNPEQTVLVAQRIAERDELAADAAWNSAWPFIVAVPLSWLSAYWLVGAIMKRLQSLAVRVEAREIEANEPLSVEDAPLEVQPLVIAINRAFERVRQALAQQRDFLADAAHELRTPVAALALQVENLKQATSADKRAEATADLDAGVRRAAQVATQLLRLARSESIEETVGTAPIVGLADAVQDCLGRFLATADVRAIDLGLVRADRCQVRIEPLELAAILDIVVDNALRYTPEGTEVDLAVCTENRMATVTVTDRGPGIPEELRERVFDRFYRAGPSGSDGSGLGLAIARNLAGRYGGTIGLGDNPAGAGLRVTLSLPLA